MKPLLNIAEITQYESLSHGNFAETMSPVSEKIGAQKLSYSVMILQPGFKSCPFHNHHINEEMFLVLEGEGTVRFGSERYPIKQHDVIACPPGGQEVAHQIINTGNEPLKVFCLSTTEPVDICEYPDSQKTLSMVGQQGKRTFRHIARLGESVDYFENEQ